MSRDSKPLKKHKRRWSLLPLYLFEDAVDVMSIALDRHGYVEHSWQHCPPEEVPIKYGEALARHFAALQRGEWIDADSGKPHLACIMANGAIWLWHGKRDERARSAWGPGA